MKKDIEEYIKKCDTCQRFKHRIPLRMPLRITDVAQKPFEKLYLDIVEGFPTSNKGNNVILSICDDLTRFVIFESLPDQKAETIARALFEEVFCRYLIPTEVVTDKGANFCGKVIKQLCKLLGVKKLQTTSFRPSSR